MPNTGRLRGEVRRKAKLLTEAPVNGGPNYEGLPDPQGSKGPSLNPAICGNTRASCPTPSNDEVTMGQVGSIRRKGSARRILRDWTPEIDAEQFFVQG